ncbi:MAG: hypothetical protein QM831_06805 [Kofleriaceae bacterium]
MRFKTFAIASALAASLVFGPATGHAFTPHKGSEKQVISAGTTPRTHRTVGSTAPAHLAMRLGTFADWQQIWDRDTDVPLRMWGPSIPFFASTANATTAENAARQMLAKFSSVLAPGASVADLQLITNELDASQTIRTVAFQQYAQGIPVLGGAVAFTFERDHLVMISSTALPNVRVTTPAARLAHVDLEASAHQFLADANIATTTLGHGDRVIVPIVRERGARKTVAIEYHVADTVTVQSTGEAGQWDVWLDATTGAPIARKSNLLFASGTVLFDIPNRYPSNGRVQVGAPNADHVVNGAVATSDANGLVTWTGVSPATVAPVTAGSLISVTTAQGTADTGSLSLADGGSVTWNESADGMADAQLDAFVFASTAKQFVRDHLNPSARTTTFLNKKNSVTVNENDVCNAFSTGNAEHFFAAGASGNTNCENTGRIADVVYHEFGHSVHNNSYIPGEGAFDGSLSEGLADTLAVSITGDHGMGKGFFVGSDEALRDVQATHPKVWPQDADGEPHDEGEIIGEALWDTRVALQAKYGDAAGFDVFKAVYYTGVMQHAADIPSSLPAALLGNDDDGDLSNGTPDSCEITAAFAKHGLASTEQAVTALVGLKPPTLTNLTVSLPQNATGGNPACPTPTITSATLNWHVAGGTATDIPMTVDADHYTGDLPSQADGTVVLYHIAVVLSDGTKLQFPDNKADPDYQAFIGKVTPIQCFDFEADAQGWTHTGTGGGRGSVADEWEVGMPLGIGGDPTAAHGGNNALGQDFGDTDTGDGDYDDGTKSSASSPQIMIPADATNVRLQYYRWLGVEDGAYDQAQIFANDMSVWQNFTSPGDPQTNEVNHVDREWRFQDVDITAQATPGMPLTLKYELDSDQGLTLAGWNIDDVCVVTYSASGVTTGGDDGGGGGCCSSSRSSNGAIGLSLLTLGLVLRRRKR